MNELIAIAGAAVLLLALALRYRTRTYTVRSIPALKHMKHWLGQSVEDGSRVHLALGSGDMLSPQGGPGLAGLAILRQLSPRAAAGDRPPVGAAGDAVLALMAQETMRAGYRAAGVEDQFQTSAGRLAGLGPLGYTAGSMSMISDEHVSAALLVGHFGAEAALLAESAERQGASVLGASDDLGGQAVLYAASAEPLVGEEAFAAAAHLGAGSWHQASLTVQDFLRWLIILALLLGSFGRLAGLL
jgi:hypothetical protein